MSERVITIEYLEKLKEGVLKRNDIEKNPETRYGYMGQFTILVHLIDYLRGNNK